MTSTASKRPGQQADAAASQHGEGDAMRLPDHVAIIMDGNGRWARDRGKRRSDGHRAGYENVRRVVAAAATEGIKYLTLFAFSTENWERPTEEVTGILDLAAEVMRIEVEDLHANNVRVKHVGRLDRLPAGLQKEILDAVELTRDNTGLTLGVAFDYGGRYDIVQATQRIVRDGVKAEDITEELLSSYLFTGPVPDPDLVIRTGGEFRISNFLLWQSAYAEFYSSPVFWPDFDAVQLRKALDAYGLRERRFGRV
jgi:undecaprenyl diphosphate synthase